MLTKAMCRQSARLVQQLFLFYDDDFWFIDLLMKQKYFFVLCVEAVYSS